MDQNTLVAVGGSSFINSSSISMARNHWECVDGEEGEM